MKDKKEKGWYLYYDRAVLPLEMTIKEMSDTAQKTSIVQWDSTLPHEGKPIQLVSVDGSKNNPMQHWRTRCVKTGREEFIYDKNSGDENKGN